MTLTANDIDRIGEEITGLSTPGDRPTGIRQLFNDGGADFFAFPPERLDGLLRKLARGELRGIEITMSAGPDLVITTQGTPPRIRVAPLVRPAPMPSDIAVGPSVNTILRTVRSLSENDLQRQNHDLVVANNGYLERARTAEADVARLQDIVETQKTTIRHQREEIGKKEARIGTLRNIVIACGNALYGGPIASPEVSDDILIHFPQEVKARIGQLTRANEAQFQRLQSLEAAPPAASGSGDFSIGATLWPGTGKAVEEMGELLTLLGKLIGSRGQIAHWDGQNLKARMMEEIPDVSAALGFLAAANGLDAGVMFARQAEKVRRFEGWHREGLDRLEGKRQAETDRLFVPAGPIDADYIRKHFPPTVGVIDTDRTDPDPRPAHL